MSGDKDPVLWRIFEGILVNFLVLIAVLITLVMGVWEMIKSIFVRE